MRAVGQADEPIRVEFSCAPESPCSVNLDLSVDRLWEAMVEAPGHGSDSWTPVEKGSLAIWPSIEAEGKLLFQGVTTPPSVVFLRFRAESPQDPNEAITGETACSLSDALVRCRVPIGVVDLSIRVKGFVTVYKWRQQAKAGSALQLGAIELRKGASLVGNVISKNQGAPKPGACLVRIRPASNSPMKADSSPPALPSGTVDGRGFFQLEAVPPGQWEVVAEQEGFAFDKQAVLILEGTEARLKNPLVLSRPVRLDVSLVPPQDPTGNPWRVSLHEMKAEGRSDLVSESPATAGGQWSREGLREEGKYQLEVLTTSRQRWWGDPSFFTLAATGDRRTVLLDVVKVNGSLSLEGEPLRGRVVFGGTHRTPSVALESNDDGNIEGFLPRLGKWAVEVFSESKQVRRTLETEVRRRPNGDGEFAIPLNGRVIEGEIVSENGERAEKSVLHVLNRNTLEDISQRVEGGAFQVGGLEPGVYRLRAATHLLASDDVLVTLPKDGNPDSVRLVLKKKPKVTIRVIGPSGAGLPGVPVHMFTNALVGSADSNYTGADGRLEFEALPSAESGCFLIRPPGMPLKFAGVPFVPDEQTIQVDRSGGSLELDYPDPSPENWPKLVQGPCGIPPGMLAHILRSTNKKLFPSVAAGQYSLCSYATVNGQQSQRGACRSGTLAPYGNLRLSLLSADAQKATSGP
ncbi:MAG: hypothetical protein DIJKHBIC_03108 [Thermoanaerobaculia bacterium]|nr:hypothetical protein [Thermoanaerobaculia bacterium]